MWNRSPEKIKLQSQKIQVENKLHKDRGNALYGLFATSLILLGAACTLFPATLLPGVIFLSIGTMLVIGPALQNKCIWLAKKMSGFTDKCKSFFKSLRRKEIEPSNEIELQERVANEKGALLEQRQSAKNYADIPAKTIPPINSTACNLNLATSEQAPEAVSKPASTNGYAAPETITGPSSTIKINSMLKNGQDLSLEEQVSKASETIEVLYKDLTHAIKSNRVQTIAPNKMRQEGLFSPDEKPKRLPQTIKPSQAMVKVY